MRSAVFLQAMMRPLIIGMASQYFLEILCLITKNQLIMAYVIVLGSSGQLDLRSDRTGKVL